MVDGEEMWYRGDDNDMKAKAAFEALLRLRLFWPSNDVFETFSKKVKQRSLDTYDYDYGSEKVRWRSSCRAEQAHGKEQTNANRSYGQLVKKQFAEFNLYTSFFEDYIFCYKIKGLKS